MAACKQFNTCPESPNILFAIVLVFPNGIKPTGIFDLEERKRPVTISPTVPFPPAIIIASTSAASICFAYFLP